MTKFPDISSRSGAIPSLYFSLPDYLPSSLSFFLLVFVFLCAPFTVHAAAFKCLQDGKVTYGDQPCHEGQGKLVPLSQTTTERDAQLARERAQQEKRALEKIEHDAQRDAQQAQKSQQHHAREIAAQNRLCSALAQHQKWREEDALRASPRSAEKAKRHARRAAEKYAAHCQPA
jgi:hypothetical protein